jgi:hypothetical protein
MKSTKDLEEMAHCRSGQGKYKMSLEHFTVPKSEEVLKMWHTFQKDIVTIQGTPNGQIWDNLINTIQNTNNIL